MKQKYKIIYRIIKPSESELHEFESMGWKVLNVIPVNDNVLYMIYLKKKDLT